MLKDFASTLSPGICKMKKINFSLILMTTPIILGSCDVELSNMPIYNFELRTIDSTIVFEDFIILCETHSLRIRSHNESVSGGRSIECGNKIVSISAHNFFDDNVVKLSIYPDDYANPSDQSINQARALSVDVVALFPDAMDISSN